MQFIKMVTKQCGLSLKAFQMDGRAKYKPMISLLKQDGIGHWCTYPHTFEQHREVESGIE